MLKSLYTFAEDEKLLYVVDRCAIVKGSEGNHKVYYLEDVFEDKNKTLLTPDEIFFEKFYIKHHVIMLSSSDEGVMFIRLKTGTVIEHEGKKRFQEGKLYSNLIAARNFSEKLFGEGGVSSNLITAKDYEYELYLFSYQGHIVAEVKTKERPNIVFNNKNKVVGVNVKNEYYPLLPAY